MSKTEPNPTRHRIQIKGQPHESDSVYVLSTNAQHIYRFFALDVNAHSLVPYPLHPPLPPLTFCWYTCLLQQYYSTIWAWLKTLFGNSSQSCFEITVSTKDRCDTRVLVCLCCGQPTSVLFQYYWPWHQASICYCVLFIRYGAFSVFVCSIRIFINWWLAQWHKYICCSYIHSL